MHLGKMLQQQPVNEAIAAAELLAQEQERYAQRQVIRFALAEAKANSPDRVAELEQQLAEAAQAAIAAREAE